MLIGPDAPLVIDRGIRSSFMQHVYDFYKPDMSSEYPVVDAKLSIQSYLHALDSCYAGYKTKCSTRGLDPVTLSTFDAVLFHTPYCKLVQKSVGRLALNDFVTTPSEERNLKFPGLEKFANITLEESYFDRDVEKAFMGHTAQMFETKTKPSLLLATNVGNMYTPSVYGGLVSYLLSQPAERLAGQKVALFSYGSGLASSFFSLTVSQPGPALNRLLLGVSDVESRLLARTKVSPPDFEACLGMREKAIHAAPHNPAGDTNGMFPGTWYLTGVDDKHRRQYARTQLDKDLLVNGTKNGVVQNGHA
jgi:hydroxymethylglutaryl-CoA synthase